MRSFLVAAGLIAATPALGTGYISPSTLGDVCKTPYGQCIAAGALDNGLGTGAGPGVWAACINIVADGKPITNAKLDKSKVTFSKDEGAACVAARVAKEKAK